MKTREQLEKMSRKNLVKLAKRLGIQYANLSDEDLVEEILFEQDNHKCDDDNN